MPGVEGGSSPPSRASAAGRPLLPAIIGHQLIAGVDAFLLAKNIGTSSDMIERFNGQVKLERMAKELRPGWRVGPSEEI